MFYGLSECIQNNSFSTNSPPNLFETYTGKPRSFVAFCPQRKYGIAATNISIRPKIGKRVNSFIKFFGTKFGLNNFGESFLYFFLSSDIFTNSLISVLISLSSPPYLALTNLRLIPSPLCNFHLWQNIFFKRRTLLLNSSQWTSYSQLRIEQ